MPRYLRLYAYFVRFSVSRSLAFRLDFTFRIVMDLIFYAVNIAFYKILFLRFPTLAGWSESQTLIFVAGYLFVDALQMTLFSNNLWWFAKLINRGDLDYYLVRPVSTLFFVSLRDFAANSFINLLMTLGILVWAIAQYGSPIPWHHLLIYFLLLLNGTFLFYCVQILFNIPAFWTQSIVGFRETNWALMKVSERPDGIFQGWSRKAFTVFLPFCLMSSFPARAIIDGPSFSLLLHTTLVTAGFFGLVLLIWHLGLRSYSSASS